MRSMRRTAILMQVSGKNELKVFFSTSTCLALMAPVSGKNELKEDGAALVRGQGAQGIRQE